MKNQTIKSNLILLLAAAIWGFAFVAQQIGSKYLGAFSFNGIRFALGSISLIPLIMFNKINKKEQLSSDYSLTRTVFAGIITGTVLFLAASLQQIGIMHTTVGKAAFITGLYIVLVPIFGIFLKHSVKINMWLGAGIALAGLYILSINENLTISKGDLIVLIGAVFWAVHILLIDHYTKKINALILSFIQFATCSLLSLTTAVFIEKITLYAISQALIPLLYGGIFSVGIAYTLQVVGQKNAKPSHAAIVLSMETVFASIGGFIILKENLGMRGYSGCLLMLIGMILSQLQFRRMSFKRKLVKLESE